MFLLSYELITMASEYFLNDDDTDPGFPDNFTCLLSQCVLVSQCVTYS